LSLSPENRENRCHPLVRRRRFRVRKRKREQPQNGLTFVLGLSLVCCDLSFLSMVENLRDFAIDDVQRIDNIETPK